MKSGKIKSWIEAFRLRTLFLALSSVVAGSIVPESEGNTNWLIFSLTLLTTIALQILSNLANDYGDFKKGTDNQYRTGPMRSVQSGRISQKEMKWMIRCFVFLSLLFGIILLFLSFYHTQSLIFLVFFMVGLASVWAAIKYTVGNNAYGYAGFGDVFVFLFFGLVGVLGSRFLQTLVFDPKLLLPASSFGLLSVGVLNLNNMRDLENDRMCHKKTIPVRVGLYRAKLYHFGLVLLAFLALMVYTIQFPLTYLHLPLLFILPLFLLHLYRVWKRKDAQLDPLLKELSLSVFIFALLFAFSFHG